MTLADNAVLQRTLAPSPGWLAGAEGRHKNADVSDGGVASGLRRWPSRRLRRPATPGRGPRSNRTPPARGPSEPARAARCWRSRRGAPSWATRSLRSRRARPTTACARGARGGARGGAGSRRAARPVRRCCSRRTALRLPRRTPLRVPEREDDEDDAAAIAGWLALKRSVVALCADGEPACEQVLACVLCDR